MNYERIYNSLIERSIGRVLDVYTEKHHIIPRCMGGSDDASNLAKLTAEEHFLAHQLLVKINPSNHKLALAVKFMCTIGSCAKRNNKEFGWIRRRAIESLRNPSIETRAKIAAHRKSKKSSIETRAKISRAKTGLVASEETRTKMSASRMGHIVTQETRDKMSRSKSGDKCYIFGKSHSEETRKKISASNKGRIVTDDDKSRISAALMGHPVSDETKRKLREKNIGKKLSDETRAKMSASRKRNLEVVECPHCNATGKRLHLTPHHFDNCQFKGLSK